MAKLVREGDEKRVGKSQLTKLEPILSQVNFLKLILKDRKGYTCDFCSLDQTVQEHKSLAQRLKSTINIELEVSLPDLIDKTPQCSQPQLQQTKDN